jgi:mannobiose 2-epimerase
MRQTVLIIIFALALTTITIGQTMRVFKEHDKELEDLIHFFNKNAFQADTGVYLSEIDNTGKIVSSKVFTVALNRMIYGLSYAHFIDSSYLEKAKKSSDFIITHLIAKDSKGYYFKSYYDVKSGNADSSQMLDIWQQAYGLCGLTELYRQQPDAKLLSVIHMLHNDFVNRFHDSINGGFFGNYDLNKGAVAESKTLQSLMYPLTAYMENLWIADTANRKMYEPYLQENLKIAYQSAWNKDLGWVNLKFDDNWNLCKHESPEKPCFTVSPGHNFQFASLLLRTKDWIFLTNAEQKMYKELGMEIIQKTLKKNIYPANNLTQGFYSLVNPLTNKILDDRKTWWQHCEALIALSLADTKYETELKELEQFYFSNFPDNKNGGEFFYLDKLNIPITSELKGSIGKSAYHSVEMVRFLSNRPK